MKQEQVAVVQRALEYISETSTYLPCSFDNAGIEVFHALGQLIEHPQPEHDHTLEQALTRLQKRYSELENQVIALRTVLETERGFARQERATTPLTQDQIDLIINGCGDEGDDDYVEPTGDGFGLTDEDLVKLVRRVENLHGIK